MHNLELITLKDKIISLHLFFISSYISIKTLTLCSPCDCAAYRTRLWVVPAVGRGGSKWFSFDSTRRDKLLSVHSHVELGSHIHFKCFPLVSLKVKSLLTWWLLPFPYTSGLLFFLLFFSYAFSAIVPNLGFFSAWDSCFAVQVKYDAA